MAQRNLQRGESAPEGSRPSSAQGGQHSCIGAETDVCWKEEIDELPANLRKAGVIEIDDQIGTIIIRDWVTGIINAQAKRKPDKEPTRKRIWRNLIVKPVTLAGILTIGTVSCVLGSFFFLQILCRIV